MKKMFRCATREAVAMSDAHYTLEAAMEQFQRAMQFASPSRPLRLVIRKHNPGGMSGHGTTEVESIAVGFDWEAGRVIIHPAKPLTELSSEQVEAIEKSVRAGGSWHAFEAQKKLRERALKAEARAAELELLLELRTPDGSGSSGRAVGDGGEHG
jgi:hypothetical protein